jgi:outer membrane protein TolC
MAADFAHNATLLDVALGAELAYYELLASQALMRVAEDAVLRRTKYVEFAERRLNAGVGRQVEYLRAKADLADANLSRVRTRSQVRVARGRLASALGLPVSQGLEVAEVPDAVRVAEREECSQLLLQAARKRPILKAAAAEVNRYRAVLEGEEARRWPELLALASFGWRGNHLVSEEGEEWSLGLALDWPLFTGFQRHYNIRRARAELDRALAAYQNQLQGVELEIWEAYAEVLGNQEALGAADAFLESAELSLQATEKAYRAGTATYVEVVDAESTLTEAEARKVKAALDWHNSIARLERAVGRSWQLRIKGQACPEPSR